MWIDKWADPRMKWYGRRRATAGGLQERCGKTGRESEEVD